MIQESLLDWTPPEPKGSTYVPERDKARLNAQCRKVFAVMQDREWRTLGEVSSLSGAPEASASARLRDLRKSGHQIERRRLDGGLYEYRMAS